MITAMLQVWKSIRSRMALSVDLLAWRHLVALIGKKPWRHMPSWTSASNLSIEATVGVCGLSKSKRAAIAKKAARAQWAKG
jgi:hypothetical protein